MRAGATGRIRDRDISRREPIDGALALEQVPNSDIQANPSGKTNPSPSGACILTDLVDRAAVYTLPT